MNSKTTKYNLKNFKSLGYNIATERKKLMYSQNKLAEILNISREHLAKIETAKRAVSLDLLMEIACALNIKVKDLIDF